MNCGVGKAKPVRPQQSFGVSRRYIRVLTYRLQDRLIHLLQPGAAVKFPSQVRIKVKLGPPEVFGTSDAPSSVFIPGRAATAHDNGNTGRMSFKSNPPLEPLNVVVEWPSAKRTLTGDELIYERICDEPDDLEASIHALHYLFPVLLNLGFPEPPYVISVAGDIGGVPFDWIHRQSALYFSPVDPDLLQEEVGKAVNRMDVWTW